MQGVEGQRTFNFHGNGVGALFKALPPDVETRENISYTYVHNKNVA